jgi:replication-associated recombination protein RarA
MSLFDNVPGRGPATPQSEQAGLAFPARLTEKYRPHTFADFVGLEKPKKIMQRFAECPKSDAFLFIGSSGIGKTTMALAFCELIRGELHHVPSQTCNVETLENVIRQCHYYPANGKSFHVVIVDEADQMSKPAQLHLLSKLDATAFPPNTIFIFTANASDALADRFLSRCKQIPFQSHGLAEQTAQFLEAVWLREVGETAEKPNFLRIVRDSQNNVRNALNMLETEILVA